MIWLSKNQNFNSRFNQVETIFTPWNISSMKITPELYLAVVIFKFRVMHETFLSSRWETNRGKTLQKQVWPNWKKIKSLLKEVQKSSWKIKAFFVHLKKWNKNVISIWVTQNGRVELTFFKLNVFTWLDQYWVFLVILWFREGIVDVFW